MGRRPTTTSSAASDTKKPVTKSNAVKQQSKAPPAKPKAKASASPKAKPVKQATRAARLYTKSVIDCNTCSDAGVCVPDDDQLTIHQSMQRLAARVSSGAAIAHGVPQPELAADHQAHTMDCDNATSPATSWLEGRVASSVDARCPQHDVAPCSLLQVFDTTITEATTITDANMNTVATHVQHGQLQQYLEESDVEACHHLVGYDMFR